MTIEEAIKNRENCLEYLEKSGPLATKENVQAVRLSLEALREKAEREKNAPLTREKLVTLLAICPCESSCEGLLGSCPDRKNSFCNNFYKLPYCAFGKLADHLIANGVTVQEWISVKDRLPNYFDHVLINAPGDKPFATVHEAHLRKDGLWDTGLYRYDKEDVTHWMPLPQPPKGE